MHAYVKEDAEYDAIGDIGIVATWRTYMSQYEVEITVVFSKPQLARKFAQYVVEETGYAAGREDRSVTCLVRDHGNEFVLREMAEELGGTLHVKVLEDRE